jgi:hypothetical protein
MSWETTQIISVLFYDPADSEVVNRIGVNNRPVGLYSGGYLTIINDTTVALSALKVEIGSIVSGEYHQVFIETVTSKNVTVGYGTPYVVLRWNYAESTSNPMTVHAVALGDILAGDVLVGKCIFAGSTLTGIIYDYDATDRIHTRTVPLSLQTFLRVVPTIPASMRVRISKGWCNFGQSNVFIADQESPLFTAPGSNSRIDLLYVSTAGVLTILQGTAAASPVAPTYGGKMVLAEVRLTAGQTSITAVNIQDTRGVITASSAIRTVMWYQPEDLEVANNVSARIYLPFGGTIVRARAYAKTAPLGANLIIDLKKNGSTIFGATKLVVAAGANLGSQTTITNATCAVDDYYTMDITQIGSSTPGADLSVMLDIVSG